jgi:hypothetical protein
MRGQMQVRSRVLYALTPPLLAVTLGAAACGGERKPTPTQHSKQARSVSSASRAQGARAKVSLPVAAWPEARLLRRIAGKLIEVEGRRVLIDRMTITCDGEGPGSLRGRARVWERFVYIQPTFGDTGAPGPDAVFHVQPTGPRSFRTSDARFTRY